MRSRRAIWAAGSLFVAHEALLHSPANAFLEQGGLFGPDRAQDIVLGIGTYRLQFVPTISTMIHDKLGRPAAIAMLEMLTSRHDPRVVGALLDLLKANTFRLLLQHVDDDRPGLTDGIRVVLNMASVQDSDLQWRFIDTLIRTGAVDRFVEEILIAVPQRSGGPITLRQWLVQDPNEAIQFIRERETAIRTFSRFLSHPRFCKQLRSDFDSCFRDPRAIRRLLGNDSYPGAALVAVLAKSAVGAIGKLHAVRCRALFLASLPEDDPQRRLLANTIDVKGGAMLSFVMPHFEDGKQISIERMKLAGSLGMVSAVTAAVIGRRTGTLVRNLLRTGLGSSLFVLWNDLFINWDRFFVRDTFPVFDRSTDQGRTMDLVWSTLCSCLHYAGNLSLYAAFPGSFLPYLLISSSHFTGELYALGRLTGATPPARGLQLWIGSAPSGDI